MDILISRNGEQSGPYSDADAHALLRAGKVHATDLAWRPGMGDWLPLKSVLGIEDETGTPSAAKAPEPAPSQPQQQSPLESATQRQKAFLTYMAVPFSSELTREKAAQLVNEAMADRKRADRVKRWDRERLRLFPDLFADELKAQKENRAQHFLDACQAEGAAFFEGVSKAHTQVLVGYLDVHHPNWDHGEESVQYFFAAVSEKFPQLVKKSAKGQLKYPDGSRVAREIAVSKNAERARSRHSPLAAAVRGVVIGLVVLGVMYGALRLYDQRRVEVDQWLARWFPARSGDTPAAQTAAATSASMELAPKPAGTPSSEGENRTERKRRNQSRRSASRQPEQSSEATPSPEPAPASALAGATPPPTAAATSAATMPALFEPAPAAGTAAPATPAPRTSVTITKATSIPLRFGISTLSAGTAVPLVSVEGQTALVRFGSEVVRVPVANTDIEPPR